MELSGYKILKQIGRGGMATVYKGVQTSLNRPVAIKVLDRALVSHSEIHARFERESYIIAKLDHPNIIRVIDRGLTPEGQPYFVMDYIEGLDLKALIKKGSLKISQRVGIAIQVCKALSYAHENGIIHRDLKPANILVDKRGNARMLDFGIAHFYEDEDDERSAMETKAGDVMGTMAYMAPEQMQSADLVTSQSDLYSFGVVLYELLTCKLPLGRFQLPSVVNPKVPKALDKVVDKCLSPDPVARPVSANVIKTRLLKILKGAHLGTAQKERASETLKSAKNNFSLLDVIKDDKYGAVYLFEDKQKHELLVIKKRQSTNTGFIQSKLLSQLTHPNIVNVIGTSKNERVFIIVMEYLKGGCLQDRLIRPYSLTEFKEVALQICRALNFAHNNRILHGNLRPKNILFTEHGVAKIVDFGFDEHYGEGRDNWYEVSGEERTGRTDIYAAGLVFFQMIAGESGKPKSKKEELVGSENFDKAPGRLQSIIKKMTDNDVEERYQSFVPIIDEIEAVHIEKEEVVVPYERPIRQPKKKSIAPVIITLVLVFGFLSAESYYLYTGNPNVVFDKIHQLSDQAFDWMQSEYNRSNFWHIK